LELIVGRYSKGKDGEYIEENVLRIPPDQAVTAKMIGEALGKKDLPEKENIKPVKKTPKPKKKR